MCTWGQRLCHKRGRVVQCVQRQNKNIWNIYVIVSKYKYIVFHDCEPPIVDSVGLERMIPVSACGGSLARIPASRAPHGLLRTTDEELSVPGIVPPACPRAQTRTCGIDKGQLTIDAGNRTFLCPTSDTREGTARGHDVTTAHWGIGCAQHESAEWEAFWRSSCCPLKKYVLNSSNSQYI